MVLPIVRVDVLSVAVEEEEDEEEEEGEELSMVLPGVVDAAGPVLIELLVVVVDFAPPVFNVPGKYTRTRPPAESATTRATMMTTL